MARHAPAPPCTAQQARQRAAHLGLQHGGSLIRHTLVGVAATLQAGCMCRRIVGEAWAHGNSASVVITLPPPGSHTTHPATPPHPTHTFMLGTTRFLVRDLRRIWENTLMDWPRARR